MPGVFTDGIIASPLYDKGLVYVVSQGGAMNVLDAKTGKRVYAHAMDSLHPRLTWVFVVGICSSTTLGGNYIFVRDDQGQTLVIEPGPQYKELAKNLCRQCRIQQRKGPSPRPRATSSSKAGGSISAAGVSCTASGNSGAVGWDKIRGTRLWVGERRPTMTRWKTLRFSRVDSRRIFPSCLTRPPSVMKLKVRCAAVVGSRWLPRKQGPVDRSPSVHGYQPLR